MIIIVLINSLPALPSFSHLQNPKILSSAYKGERHATDIDTCQDDITCNVWLRRDVTAYSMETWFVKS